MIYICEYDGFLGAGLLQKLAEELPLIFPEGWKNGVKWEKARQRILAWLLLAYGMEQEFCENGIWTENEMQEGFTKLQNRESNIAGSMLKKLEIRRDAYGKPCSSACPEIQFNLSHCDTACACIVGCANAGVDIERKFAYRDNLARKVCHSNEARILNRLEPKERQRQLRLLWSLKESFVKLDGRGLGYGLERIDLSEFLPMDMAGIYNKEEIAFRIAEHSSYTLAACSTDQMVLEPIQIISEQELLEQTER